MTCNQVVSTMFDFDTCIHMVRFVLYSGGDEDPGSFLTDSGCIGVFQFVLLHRSTLYVSWLCSNLSL
jgi:hypothetical protein